MTTLILLPGMDGTGTLFAPLIEALGTEINVRVVVYPATEPLDYPKLEILARDSLPTEEPFVVLSESFSGPIAISLAASHPPQFQGLILCSTFARNPRPEFSFMRSIVAFLPIRAVPTRLLNHLLLGRFGTPTLNSTLADAIERVAPSVVRARLKATLNIDVSEKLAAVSVPVLYLRATRDRVVPRAASEIASRSCPHMKIVDVEGPHLLLQATPVESAQLIRTFIHRLRT